MDFSPQISGKLGVNSFARIEPSKVHELRHEFEKQLLDFIMQRMNGNQSRAAACMGINRNTLRKRIAKYEIDAQKMRDSSPKDNPRVYGR